jgi:hypothetical protein
VRLDHLLSNEIRASFWHPCDAEVSSTHKIVSPAVMRHLDATNTLSITSQLLRSALTWACSSVG